ncbi:hypothetical protein [Amycolatopsis kentuckyensis]|uniref:hypothetical protein n=1 Tax=Amycolatopsis kentuckyensis TaxID=218823 RepID=UPI001FC928EA|nr:hypothetical protein [Amycolatopsis kentuckyensis]
MDGAGSRCAARLEDLRSGDEEPARAARVAPIVAWIRRRGPVFADFRVEPGAGVPRLADVSCWPGHDLFPDCEDQVYAALLAGLAS